MMLLSNSSTASKCSIDRNIGISHLKLAVALIKTCDSQIPSLHETLITTCDSKIQSLHKIGHLVFRVVNLNLNDEAILSISLRWLS